MRENWTYSFTQLEAFAGCPRRYYLPYVKGIRQPQTEDQERGDIVHQVISGTLDTGEVPEDIAKRLLEKAKHLSVEEHLETLSQLARNFLDHFKPTGEFLTERKVVWEIAPGIRFQGKIDLQENVPGEHGPAVVITDFKTGWTRYRPTDKAQLPLYALPVAEERGLDAVTARLWFLPYKRAAVEQEVIDRRRMEEAREWAIDQVAQIEAALELPAATGFPATPGSACRLCSFGAQCLGLDVPPAVEDAAALALRLERALDAVRGLVKAQVDAGRPVRVGGEEFKNWPRVSWSFDVKALADFLQGAGQDPYKLLVPDSEKLKTLLKGKLGDQVKALGKENRGTYFAHRSVGDSAA